MFYKKCLYWIDRDPKKYQLFRDWKHLNTKHIKPLRKPVRKKFTAPPSGQVKKQKYMLYSRSRPLGYFSFFCYWPLHKISTGQFETNYLKSAMKVPVGLMVRLHEFGDYLSKKKIQKMQKPKKKVYISVYCAIKGKTFLT